MKYEPINKMKLMKVKIKLITEGKKNTKCFTTSNRGEPNLASMERNDQRSVLTNL